MTLPSIIAAWAALWVLVAALVTVAGLRRGRPLPAAAWLVTIGAFLAAQEDPLLIIQMASSRRSPGFGDGVLGLVHAHTRAHMYGAATLALAGLGLAVVIAHFALRRGEAWAWWALAGIWLLGTAADVYEVFGLYPHGFPLAPTPADGVRGFGWATLTAWIVIWAAGLAVAAPAVLAAKRQSRQATSTVCRHDLPDPEHHPAVANDPASHQ
jgi:hypothetical protein